MSDIITITDVQPVVIETSTTEFQIIVVAEQGPTGATGAAGSQGDPGEGVPAGGTAGQVLTKIDGTDYNTDWTSVVTTDKLVAVSSNDTTPGYLNGKLVAGSNVVLTENNDGSNETLTVSLSGVSLSGHTHLEADITDLQAYALDADLTTHTSDGTIHFTEASIDHANILNIGTNTHAQIDTHIADSTIHFTQAAISITESQINNLGTTIVLDSDIGVTVAAYGHNHTVDSLSNVVITTPSDGQALVWDTVTSKWINETINSAVWGNITGTLSDQTDLQSALDGKASTSHNHDSDYISIVSTPTTGNFPVLTAGGELNNSAYGPSDFASSGHNHDADYISIIGSPVTDNFVKQTAGGELVDAGVNASSFATSGHTHVLDDLTDVTITAAATGDILRFNGTAWVDYPDSNYATSGHNHTGTYQPLDSDLTDIAAFTPTKGKIMVGDGSNWQVLTVGTDAYVLTADSAQTTGIKWAAAAGGGGGTVGFEQNFLLMGA